MSNPWAALLHPPVGVSPLSITPVRLPTLEPVKDAIAAAVADLWDAAAAYVSAANPSPALTLPAPGETVFVTVGPQRLPQRWPALFISGSNIRAARLDDQGHGAGRWLGSLDLGLFVQAPNDISAARLMDRYAAALWLCIINANPLAGWARTEDETVSIEAAEGDPNAPLLRGVMLSFDVSWRT